MSLSSDLRGLCQLEERVKEGGLADSLGACAVKRGARNLSTTSKALGERIDHLTADHRVEGEGIKLAKEEVQSNGIPDIEPGPLLLAALVLPVPSQVRLGKGDFNLGKACGRDGHPQHAASVNSPVTSDVVQGEEGLGVPQNGGGKVPQDLRQVFDLVPVFLSIPLRVN